MVIRKLLVLLVGILLAMPAIADETSTSNMDILRDKIKADKKLVVAANLDLTTEEAQEFWPVYEKYQEQLAKLNQRTTDLIVSYAQDYNNNSLTDEKAQKLIDEALAIEGDETTLKKEMVPQLSSILPARKVARYIQIENKIRAAGKYELAARVPLVE